MAQRETAYLIRSENGASPAFSREFLETIIESSYDGIYITDGNAVTIMLNKSYESITGLSREDMLGRTMGELVETRVISQSGTLAALAQRETVTLEQVFKTGKHALITSTPIFDENEQVVMVVTNVRDITELRFLQKELQKSRAQSLQYHSELEKLRRRTVGRSTRFIAEDAATQETLRMAGKVAELDVPILLDGELGSGRRDMAQYIVSRSRRKKAAYVEVNCSLYSERMLEQELFGGVVAEGELPSQGLLEVADGGSIYLEEIGELSLEAQSRMVRFLRTGLVEQSGRMEPLRLDVRVLASTSRDLLELVKARRFREDLYFELNVLRIRVLPLRERREDILPLTEEMCVYLNKKYRKKKRFSPSAQEALKRYHWPGNLRELRSVVESAVILCSDDVIDQEDLLIPRLDQPTQTEESGVAGSDPVDLREIVDRLELKYIRQAYRKYGNVREAARSLGMDPSTFVRKRKKLEALEAEKSESLQKCNAMQKRNAPKNFSQTAGNR